MKEANAELWIFPCDVVCVTTNGTVKQDGSNVMGAGCAKEAVDRYPSLPLIYGGLIRHHGNHVFLIPSPVGSSRSMVMFPVKHVVQDKADPALILQSARELVTLADMYYWQAVAIPRPGCGHGGLSWDDVGPMLAPILDDRFTIIDFPKAL